MYLLSLLHIKIMTNFIIPHYDPIVEHKLNNALQQTCTVSTIIKKSCLSSSTFLVKHQVSSITAIL